MIFPNPINPSNTISTDTNPETEPASPTDCCLAGGRDTDLELIQACDVSITEENEIFSYNENDDQCERTVDIITIFTLPGEPEFIISSGTETEIEPTFADDCCQRARLDDDDLVLACNSTTSEINEAFIWNAGAGMCVRTYDLITIYSLPSDSEVIIGSGADPSFEPAAIDDCCRAGESDPDLLQACIATITEDNESFSWRESDGICTRNFDRITMYLSPVTLTIIETNTQLDSTETLADDICCE